MTNFTRPLIRTLALTAATALGLMAGGCWSPGGRLASYDEYLFESTSFDPTTITIVDTRTGQAVWSYDIPVDKALAMKFVSDERPAAAEYPDDLKWGVWKRKTDGNLYQYGGLEEKPVPVPANPYRRIDKKQRPAPELPSEMTPGVPSAPPELVPKNEPTDSTWRPGQSSPPNSPTAPDNPPPPGELPKAPPELVPKSEPPPPAKPAEPAKPTEPPVDLPK